VTWNFLIDVIGPPYWRVPVHRDPGVSRRAVSRDMSSANGPDRLRRRANRPAHRRQGLIRMRRDTRCPLTVKLVGDESLTCGDWIRCQGAGGTPLSLEYSVHVRQAQRTPREICPAGTSFQHLQRVHPTRLGSLAWKPERLGSLSNASIG
jgi:hypothetical protein